MDFRFVYRKRSEMTRPIPKMQSEVYINVSVLLSQQLQIDVVIFGVFFSFRDPVLHPVHPLTTQVKTEAYFTVPSTENYCQQTPTISGEISCYIQVKGSSILLYFSMVLFEQSNFKKRGLKIIKYQIIKFVCSYCTLQTQICLH